MFLLNNLQDIRSCEILDILTLLPKGERLLEIGAGSGLQARILAEHGFHVEAIDIPGRSHREDPAWPVQEYDGEHIPFPDNHFGIIFSSNVLEHIPHVRSFQNEIMRVLKTDGIAVHILPTASWRFYTTLAHYPYLLKILIAYPFRNTGSESTGLSRSTSESLLHMSLSQKVKKALLPSRHGEIGTSVSEMYYFSRSRWAALFQDAGWTVDIYCSNRLFYTGYGLLGSTLSIPARRRLSRLLGSSCHVFVLKKNLFLGSDALG